LSDLEKNFCAVAPMLLYTQVVIVSRLIDMSIPSERAIFFHECGHHKYGHIRRMIGRTLAKCVPTTTTTEEELEADAYAASIVGPEIILETLQRMAPLVVVDYYKLQLKLRITTLELMCTR
jgi:Zn-dependent protease with chaperone function